MKQSLCLVVLISACAVPSLAPDQPDTPCTDDGHTIECTPRIVTLAGAEVFWREGFGEAPAAGRPVVLVFHGSTFTPPATWNTVHSDLAFGGYFQSKLQLQLLEQGFTVIAPTATGGIAWQTNAPSVPVWADSADAKLMDALFTALEDGTFGAIDGARRYATGISSGGYMTSRMALSYSGRFRALAIAAGSWATCLGVACALPEKLPADHPPTLFLQGRKDAVVGIGTVEPYVKALTDQGTENELIIDDLVGHQWLSEAPERVTAWFEGH